MRGCGEILGRILVLLSLVLCLGTLQGAIGLNKGPNTTVKLVLPVESVRPGEEFTAAVVLQMSPGWHTYWKYGGDSGGPTSIKWQLPEGWNAGEIQWPVPEKLIESGLTTYIYHDEAALLVPIKVGASAAPGKVSLSANVSWLECEKVCLMGSGPARAELEVGTAGRPSSDASRFAAWSQKLPTSLPGSPPQAVWKPGATNANERILQLEWKPLDGATGFDFFPHKPDGFELKGESEPVSVQEGTLAIRKVVTVEDGKWPESVAGILTWKTASGNRKGAEVQIKPAGDTTGPVAGSSPGGGGGAATKSRPLLLWLGMAAVGGFILNFMPCVLPVIALKILGFVGQGNSSKAETRKLGLLYGLGVFVSFWVLAGVVIGVKQAGDAASWGMQLQNLKMLVVLTTLVTLVALNLFGVFEVTLASGAMGVAGNLAAKEGPAGAFFNGVLATALATPCTAPALGAALGFAFTQSAGIILLTFSAVAFGLAAPYIALCWEPAWLKFLPRPGLWMERFKIAMGFPMLATAVWLYTLTIDFFGEGGDLWFGLFLVLIGLAAWIFGAFVQRAGKGRGIGTAAMLVVLVAAIGWILERELHWRNPPVTSAGSISRKPDGIPWEPWSREAVARAQAAGKPVFVDFTAKWCLTCQVNKRTSIEIPEVTAKLKEMGAVALLENSPVKSPEIVAELNRHGRAGVPLVLVYGRDASRPPVVLPEILTPGIVLEALSQAAR